MSYPLLAAAIILALFLAVTHADVEAYRALLGEVR